MVDGEGLFEQAMIDSEPLMHSCQPGPSLGLYPVSFPSPEFCAKLSNGRKLGDTHKRSDLISSQPSSQQDQPGNPGPSEIDIRNQKIPNGLSNCFQFPIGGLDCNNDGDSDIQALYEQMLHDGDLEVRFAYPY